MLHFIKNKTLPAPFPKQLKDVAFSPAVYRSSITLPPHQHFGLCFVFLAITQRCGGESLCGCHRHCPND